MSFAVYAQCPVCIVTVGGGMLIAKKLGVDDLLVSIWISALNTAISFWLATKFKINFLRNPWILSFIMFGLTLFYFQFTGQTGHASNRVIGIDKIIFGQTLGMVAMFVGNFIYGYTKYRNNRRTLFPYAKVVFPVSVVLIVTLVCKVAFNL
jgi:hypothetical protein